MPLASTKGDGIERSNYPFKKQTSCFPSPEILRLRGKMKSGIYCIENKINGKKYIGQAQNLEKRIKDHMRNFKKEKCPKGENEPLWRAVKKYGIDNFKNYVLKFCKIKYLDDNEEKFILKLGSLTTKNGYNICQRGRIRRGVKNTEEQNKKISIANSGKNHYNYGKKGEGTPHFGFVHSDKTKKLISRNCRGKLIGKKKRKFFI